MCMTERQINDARSSQVSILRNSVSHRYVPSMTPTNSSPLPIYNTYVGCNIEDTGLWGPGTETPFLLCICLRAYLTSHEML